MRRHSANDFGKLLDKLLEAMRLQSDVRFGTTLGEDTLGLNPCHIPNLVEECPTIWFWL